VRSLLISLIGIFLAAVLLSRSLRWGAYAIIPCALAVMSLFAAMGIFAVPLGVATAMFAGMTLGIGVDFAVHLVDRIRVARNRGLATEAAVRDALEIAGPAIMVDALAVALGFGVLALSQVPANQYLGMLTVLCVSGCLLTTIVLLPVLVVVGGRPRD
jgi:predicted RND superfamily exporter protein